MGVLLNPFRFAAATTPITLGAGSTLTDSVNFNTARTWAAAHNPASSKVLLLGGGRCLGSGVDMGTVTLGAATFTQRAFRAGGSSGKAFVYIGTATGVATGSALALEIAGGNNLGNVVFRLYDLNDWGGTVGNSGDNQTDTGTPTSISASIASLMESSSFCVGVVATVNGGCDPFTASGWTHRLSADCGPNNDSDSAAGFFSTTGGSAGASLSFTPTSGTADDQWACALLELT